MNIEAVVVNDDGLFTPTNKDFKQCLSVIANQLDESGEICIKIVAAEESRDLNSNYRNKNKPTNVLSFPSDVPDYVESDYLGDLVICSAVVEQEANEQNKDLISHWMHMTVHGVLHLLGYDHIDEQDADNMEALEIKILKQMGISDPYETT